MFAGHAGLHRAVQIVSADAQHLGHARQIDRDAAVDGGKVALERRAGPERDHRDPGCRTQGDDFRDFFGGLGENDSVRNRRCMVGFPTTVLFEKSVRHGETFAKAR